MPTPLHPFTARLPVPLVIGLAALLLACGDASDSGGSGGDRPDFRGNNPGQDGQHGSSSHEEEPQEDATAPPPQSSPDVDGTEADGTLPEDGDDSNGGGEGTPGSHEAGDSQSDGNGDGASGDDGDGEPTGDGDSVPTTPVTHTPLDPTVAVPPSDNEPCTTPGSMGQCSGIAVCRHYSAEESRCESCTSCGNLNALCTASHECDILFTCFQGRCAAACSFETPQTCGVPTDCLDVGHPTHGICRPF